MSTHITAKIVTQGSTLKYFEMLGNASNDCRNNYTVGPTIFQQNNFTKKIGKNGFLKDTVK